MSRIGVIPVAIPAGVTVAADGAGTVSVKGPKGELTLRLPGTISASVADGRVSLARPDDTRKSKSLHGLSRTLVANMVLGVTKGYSKVLDIEGLGFRAEVQGAKLVMSLGFSKPVEYVIPAGIKVSVDANALTVSGADKQRVGEVSATIRDFHPPEPYKGKGIRYRGEYVRRKAGKTVA